MKQLFAIACTLLVGACLSLAQTTGTGTSSDASKPASTTKTMKHHHHHQHHHRHHKGGAKSNGSAN